MYNESGDWFEGEWKEGKMHGELFHMFEDGRAAV